MASNNYSAIPTTQEDQISGDINENDESDENPEQPSQPRPSWRQILKREFDQLRTNQITIDQMSENTVNRNKKLIQHAMKSFTSLVIPLTVTFILVLLITTNFPFFQTREYIFAYYSPIEEKSDDVSAVKFGKAMLNSLTFGAVVVVQTFIIVLLYKFKCYKIITGMLNLSVGMMLFFFSFFCITEILKLLNVPMDIFTCIFILINYSVLGMLAIFSNISLKIQQFYHVMSSAMIGCLLIRIFPEWTGWFVLGLLVFWDLFAVLAPFGPLKMLVEIAQERNEPLFPALIFKTMIEPDRDNLKLTSVLINEDNDQEDTTSQSQLSDDDEEDEYQGSQLGIGDFVFFATLIGKASLLHDLNIVFFCYIALIFGFCLTFLILIASGRALPALPISLVLGLMVYFSSAYMTAPMLDLLTSNHIII